MEASRIRNESWSVARFAGVCSRGGRRSGLWIVWKHYQSQHNSAFTGGRSPSRKWHVIDQSLWRRRRPIKAFVIGVNTAGSAAYYLERLDTHHFTQEQQIQLPGNSVL